MTIIQIIQYVKSILFLSLCLAGPENVFATDYLVFKYYIKIGVDNLMKTAGSSVLGSTVEPLEKMMMQRWILHKIKNNLDHPKHPLHETVMTVSLQWEASSCLMQNRPLEEILPAHNYQDLKKNLKTWIAWVTTALHFPLGSKSIFELN